MKHLIAALSAFAATFALAAPASAQLALLTWTDATGRVSIDLSDSEWRAYASPSPDQPDMVVMLVPPRGEETGVPSHFCSIEQSRQASDEPPTQAIANEMTRLATQIDNAAASVADQSAPPTELVERDGVVSAYERAVIALPQSGESVTRLRRHFILANADSLEWYKTTCIAFPRAGPDAPATLRGIMERVRVVPVQGGE